MIAPRAMPGLAVTYNVAPGLRSAKIYFFTTIHEDCSSGGTITAVTLASPMSGSVEYRQTQDYPNFAPPNKRVSCNIRRVPGMAIYYQRNPGFVGEDHFSTKLYYPEGNVIIMNYTIKAD
jgi:hypothetical protein